MDTDRAAYDNLILNYNMEIEKILESAVESILIELNLTKEVFETSI